MKKEALAEALGISKVKRTIIDDIVEAIDNDNDKQACVAMGTYLTLFGKMNGAETDYTIALIEKRVE